MIEQDQKDHLIEEPEESVEEPQREETEPDQVSVDSEVSADPEVTPDSEAVSDIDAPTETEVETAAEALTVPEATADAEAIASAVEGEQDQADFVPDDTYGEEDGRHWYVVHCYSGYENKVHHNLMQRIESMGMQDMIFDVVVPTEEEIEVKEGKRRTVERRVFPGYILVNMLLTEESWYVVRNTPGVTGFVGMGNTPIPLRPEEVAHIVKRMEADAPRIKVTFRTEERVRIIEGPFKDFHGTVSELDMERAKVRVMVNFFGRETPVELDFLQVEKM